MTKLLHLADVHAGVLTHSRLDPETGLPTALVSSLRCLEAAIDVAVSEQVDAVVIAGDLYHSPNPPAAAIVGVDAQLKRLEWGGIPTVVYPGNHDRAPNAAQSSIVSVHRGIFVQVAERDKIVELEDIRVGVLPSISRGRLMATGLSREQADAQIIDDLERTLGSWAEGEPQTPEVISGHWPVSGVVLGGEVDIAIIDEPMLSPAFLEGPWRYAAFGHIHRAQAIGRLELGATVVGWYSGGLDRFNFGEEDYVPVALVVDLEPPEVAVDLVPMPARVFRTIDLNETENGDAVDLAEADVRAANEGGIIRIRGRFPEGDLHREAAATAAEMSKTLTDSGASIVRLEVEALRPDRVRVAGISDAPTELEALELWITANEIDETTAGALREYARQMIEETNR